MKIYTEKELTKLYYSISEVADMFQVNTSLIRFWHKEFPNYIKPKTNAKGNRMFTPKDVVNISKIYQLVKVRGYTLDGAMKAMKAKELDAEMAMENPHKEAVIQRLENLKKKVLALRAD